MAQGITFKNDFVTINVRKYGEQLKDFFRITGTEEKAEKIMYKPNKATIGAIREAKMGKTIKFDSLDDFMNWAKNV